MAKFKVGDKVRVVRNNGDDFDGIKIGDTGEVVEICKGKYPIYLKINNHYEYGFKEEELELFEGVKEVKELTFKEVIANIKEGEVWESAYSIVSKLENRIDIEVSGNCKSIGIGDTVKFKLRRKEYTFEEAFKKLKVGKEIESVITKEKYRIIESEFKFPKGDPGKNIVISYREIEGKWYIND